MMQWRYGQFGPGGGSIPAGVMRTGMLMPFNPQHVRHDVGTRDVEERTSIPVAHQPSPGLYPTGGDQPIPGIAPTMVSPPKGTLKGATPSGRPIREFQVVGTPSPSEAKQVMAAFRQAAKQLVATGLVNRLPSALVGEPLAAMANGEAVILRWPNGMAVTASL